MFGKDGMTAIHADLLDIALAIYHYEKMQNRYQLINPTVKATMKIALRSPEVWTANNLQLLTSCLSMMGNMDWEIRTIKSQSRKPYEMDRSETTVKKVILFSGGMDSTAGIAAVPDSEKKETLLCSYYSKQKTMQREIGTSLGYAGSQHFQFWSILSSTEMEGRNRSFFYRSLLFLVVAAILADSYGASEVVQYENGILATSIPPSPSIVMTKHAHPFLHRQFSELLSNVFGRPFTINNPFLGLTKRECVDMAVKAIGKRPFQQLLERTETCWFRYSNFTLGGKHKSPNEECGICIPCIIRRTAFPESKFAIDRNDPSGEWKNHPSYGEAFRSYYAFTRQIAGIRSGSTGRQQLEFYKLLPAAGRLYFNLDKPTDFPLPDPEAVLYRMFRKFAKEFQQTFKS